jgi:hypothetical protein
MVWPGAHWLLDIWICDIIVANPSQTQRSKVLLEWFVYSLHEYPKVKGHVLSLNLKSRSSSSHRNGCCQYFSVEMKWAIYFRRWISIFKPLPNPKITDPTSTRPRLFVRVPNPSRRCHPSFSLSNFKPQPNLFELTDRIEEA